MFEGKRAYRNKHQLAKEKCAENCVQHIQLEDEDNMQQFDQYRLEVSKSIKY